MTKDDIIRMAKEAEAWSLVDHDGIAALERFANLVAAAEREACAALCFQMWSKWMDSRVGNEILDNSNCPDAEDCAFAIRERGAP